MDGFINILKPPGMTSSDAVLAVRRLLPRKTAVGHGGTLDPDAAGVLPVCVGKATRLFDYIIDKKKVYVGELFLGASTDTCDASGKVVEKSDIIPTAEDVKNALKQFVGDIMQVPPVYSALKRGGKKLYELAREGEEVEIEARKVTVHNLTYVAQTAPGRHLIRIECGKGVYIRSLMRDIGEYLSCPAHMSFLLREAAGAFTTETGFSIEEIRRPGAIEKALQPMDLLLGAYPRIDVKPEFRKRIECGNPVKENWLVSASREEDEIVRVYVEDEFCGMAERREGNQFAFRAMLLNL
ncbi:MAG: tRNA pseudouridine(55) synthase TruB [Clostridia bacterium]|nr:tRNA pseudouridine(55) synthase TruB [Clostridia bacterium]